MKLGTKSLLFGAHQFVLHPLYVALAWRKLYGCFPRDFPIWLAIMVHDWGYWGLSEIDGAEGEHHPELGARLVGALCDHRVYSIYAGDWYRFTAGHSRPYARLIGIQTSALMNADKLAAVLMPRWLYVLLVWLSSEWHEYRTRWTAAGTYPGKPSDNAWMWSGHLRDNWRRFERLDAVAGKAYGGE